MKKQTKNKNKRSNTLEEHTLTKQERDELKDIRLAAWLDQNYPEIADEYDEEKDRQTSYKGEMLYT